MCPHKVTGPGGLGSAKQVLAEPPDPCHYECEF
jgi:hypothetical protein